MRQSIYQGISYLKCAVSESKKILIVAGNSFHSLNINKEILNAITVPYAIFSKFTPNPTYEEICNGVDFFNSEKCDTIVAVGGGSAIDVAKCIKLYCKMQKDKPYFVQEYNDTGIRLIAIPTTAGSGSESTCFSVIYYNGNKQSVTHDSIIPNIAILEPKVLKTLPQYQKKCTMLDALCQGIESWWSVNSTDESKEYSKKTVNTIFKYWREYIFENTDKSAKQILNAANYSGRAICITQTTAPHAFSYKLTSMYGLPHGHAVAVGLLKIWQFMLANMEKCTDKRGEKYLHCIFQEIAYVMGTKDVREAIQVFSDMLNELEIQCPVSSEKDKDVDILSVSVNSVRLKNNPIELDDISIKKIYNDIIK